MSARRAPRAPDAFGGTEAVLPLEVVGADTAVGAGAATGWGIEALAVALVAVETSLLIDFDAVGDAGVVVVTGVLVVSSSKKEADPPAAADRRRAAVRLELDLKNRHKF